MSTTNQRATERELKPLLPDAIDTLIGILVGLTFLLRFHFQEITWKEILEALLLALAVSFFSALWREAKSWGDRIANLSSEVAFLRETMFGDERIIFARSDLDKSGRAISVVAIEDVNPVPPPLEEQPLGSSEWKQSFSILRFDRIQDLLFSAKYLEHFFTLRDKTNTRNRILIVNNRPRSVDAVRSFLQISAHLKIQTYVYNKREFYNMLKSVKQLMSNNSDAEGVCGILHGNPELNVMVDEVKDLAEISANGAPDTNSDYVLRFADASGYIVTRKPGGPSDGEERIPHAQVYSVLRLMSLACKKARKGLPAFERIVSGYSLPDNFWSDNYIRCLFEGGVGQAKTVSDIEIVQEVQKSEAGSAVAEARSEKLGQVAGDGEKGEEKTSLHLEGAREELPAETVDSNKSP